jgi:hypothetical protein
MAKFRCQFPATAIFDPENSAEFRCASSRQGSYKGLRLQVFVMFSGQVLRAGMHFSLLAGKSAALRGSDPMSRQQVFRERQGRRRRFAGAASGVAHITRI